MTISSLFHSRFLNYEAFVCIHLLNLALNVNEAAKNILACRFILFIVNNLLEYFVKSCFFNVDCFRF